MDEINNSDESVALADVAPLSAVMVDSRPMLAAIGCAGKPDAVYLHRVDNMLRIVATDSHRLFVHAREHGEHEGEWPQWLADGVLIPTDRLKPRLGLIEAATRIKGLPSGTARVAYAAEAPFVELSDPLQRDVFRFRAAGRHFPSYQGVLDNLQSFKAFKVEDMTTTSFNAAYLRDVGDLAKALGSDVTDAKGRPFPPRIRVHAGPSNEPTLITFPTCPGALLVLMPIEDRRSLGAPVMKALASPLTGTLAALRAHKTRWERKQGREAERRVAEYEARIAEIVRAIEEPALPAPEPAAGSMVEEASREEAAAAGSMVEEAVRSGADARRTAPSSAAKPKKNPPTTRPTITRPMKRGVFR